MDKKGRYGQYIRWIFTIIDFLILNGSYLVLCAFNNFSPEVSSRSAWVMLNVSFLFVTYFYSDIHERRVVYADQVLLKAAKAVITHAVVFLAAIAFMRDEMMEWQSALKFYGLFYVLLGGWWILSRKLIKMYRTKGHNYKSIIVIGCGSVGKRLVNELKSDQGYGYRIVGVFDDDEKYSTVENYKGKIADVEQFIKENQVDEMYCAIPDEVTEGGVPRLINIAESNAVVFYYVPQFGRYIPRRFELYSMGNVPVLSVRPYPLNNPLNALIKRVFDFSFSTVFLLFFPIILIPVAIGIKLSSPGPIFFKQKRTGLKGEPFNCYKFRSMKMNATADTAQATKDDPRKTKFGSFLRKTSIDELPQFFNVWRGDMSIVGPRPHMVAHTEEYSELIDKYMLRHIIKPGITGWAQVNGYRGQTDELWKMEKRVECDVWYAENWNFMLDLKIIFLTFFNVFRGEKNAF